MIGFLRRKREPAAPAPAIPPGLRVYAIGDIHGRLDLMDQLISTMHADNEGRPAARVHLIFLGDLIDRGPDSAAVVERLATDPPAFGTCHLISGNHEEALLDAMRGNIETRAGWLAYGGRETLISYGVSPAAIDAGGMLLDTAMHAAIPASHLRFIESFHRSIRIGGYLFVHAGIRPGVALEEQDVADMHWIRQDFLDDDRDHGVMVVHGHTITETVEMRSNRIGIDTGAYRTGRLTALGLEGVDRWMLQTA
ncbi:metallophosphoesterase [Sphingomonas sp. 1P06PA]|uniref:metallophosphoesterase n=1 Tax=Sphingomonas sp. 1P06PA TaxID=554121 RepID=UPI0039A4E78D